MRLSLFIYIYDSTPCGVVVRKDYVVERSRRPSVSHIEASALVSIADERVDARTPAADVARAHHKCSSFFDLDGSTVAIIVIERTRRGSVGEIEEGEV